MSTTKSNPKTQIKLVRKSNKLVEARYKFDIWEMRVFVKMISLIKPDDKDFAQYKINVSDIISDFGLSRNGKYYDFLREGAEKLLGKQVELEKIDENGKKKRITVNLISSTESFVDEDDGKDIILKFDPELKSHLLDLRQQYLTYDVRNILKLTSVHSIRIYELLKQYEGLIGNKGFVKRKFGVDELKTILGIEPSEYKLYGHFKNKVIHKAQKDLEEETDIRFDLEEEKKGRKVISVIFLIYKNITKERKGQDQEEAQVSIDAKDHPDFDSIYEKVKDHVSKEVVIQWFNELTINQIKAGVAYSIEQFKEGKVNNMAKYLQTMVRTQTLFDEQQAKSAKVEEEKRIKQQRKEQAEAAQKFEEAETNFKRQYSQLKKALMISVLQDNPKAYKTITAGLKQEVLEGTKNMFTVMAWDRYEAALGDKKESLEEFISIFESNGAVFGYAINKIAELFPDIFNPFMEEQKQLAQQQGFSQRIVF